MPYSNQQLGAAGDVVLGDTLELTITLTKNGTPYEPTCSAMEATFKLKLTDSDANALVTKTMGAGVVINGSTVTVTVPPSDLTSLSKTTTLYWSVRIEETSGVITTVADGSVTLTLKSGRTL